MGTPKVSVLMATYQETVAEVERAVSSIVGQTFQDWEMIVVADEPSNSEVITYLREKEEKDKRIKLVIHNKNRGLGAALNTAVQHARGIYIARIDTEDYSYPNRLEKQLEYFQTHPETELLFTAWREIDENGEQTIRQPYSGDAKNIKKSFFLKSLLLHPTMMTKREVLVQNPYPQMKRPEDWVLFLDLMEQDYQFRLLEEVLYDYQIDRREKYSKVRIYAENLLPVLLKKIPSWYNNPYYWLYLLRILGEYLISRNQTVYLYTHTWVTKLWRLIFGS